MYKSITNTPPSAAQEHTEVGGAQLTPHIAQSWVKPSFLNEVWGQSYE